MSQCESLEDQPYTKNEKVDSSADEEQNGVFTFCLSDFLMFL